MPKRPEARPQKTAQDVLLGKPALVVNGNPVAGTIGFSAVTDSASTLFDSAEVNLQRPTDALVGAWDGQLNFPVESCSPATSRMKFVARLRGFWAADGGGTASLSGNIFGAAFKRVSQNGNKGNDFLVVVTGSIPVSSGQPLNARINLAAKRAHEHSVGIVRVDSVDVVFNETLKR